jgi:dTDP-glucose 4,6-dehydratase/UDP-glucuronate decarboxylase
MGKNLDPSLERDSLDVIERLGDRNRLFSGATVLLTGAAGFLGTQLTHYFVQLNRLKVVDRPCRLVALDSLARGAPEWLADLSCELDLVHANIVSQRKFPRADYIIHAASIASPIFYRKHPIETMDANVQGLRNLLDHAVVEKPISFLFFSSSEIYGDPAPEFIPTPETYWGHVSCTGPRACYDESKRYGETLCVNFHAQRGVPVKVARPFNNYGPGLKITDRRVIPDFARDILAGRDLVILSDGRATRTYCYVTDAIVGYLSLLLSEHDGQAFNIGADRPEITVCALAELMIRVSGAPSKVIFQSSPDTNYTQDNPQRRCPDLTKARERLGLEPRVSLEAGLERTLSYYRAHQSAPDA